MSRTDSFGGHSFALAVAETVAFLLELALLTGVAVLGWQLGSRLAAPSFAGLLRWVAASTAPVAVAIGWGLFLAPRAVFTLPSALVLGLQGLLFAGTAAGLFVVGFRVLAVVGLAVWAIDLTAVTLLRH